MRAVVLDGIDERVHRRAGREERARGVVGEVEEADDHTATGVEGART